MATLDLVEALTAFVQRVTGRPPTLQDVERAGRLISNALEVVNPDASRNKCLARSLALTFEIAADGAAEMLRNKARKGRRAREMEVPS